MSAQNQFDLLRQRRFLPFFLTQGLGAFNDNVFKQALVILIAFLTPGLTAADVNMYTNLAAGLFILPFLLFSATSGQLSDKFDKSRLAQLVKLLEIAIMAIACIGFLGRNIPLLLAMLFLMGLHSTLFGPLKYGLLPQVLNERELVGGNGLIEMATFLAILIGTILGTSLIRIDGLGAWLVGSTTIAIAVIGLLCALAMPRTPAADPALKLNWNPFTETWRNIGYIRGNRTVFLSCLGISWFWFYGSIYFTQLPVYAKDVLGGDAGVYTLLLTVFSIGIGAGSMLCERLSGHKVEIGLVPFGSLGMTVFGIDLYFAHPVAVGELGLTATAMLRQPGIWRVLIDLVLMAIFSGFFIVPLFALIQTRSDPERRSRVIAANNIMNALFMVVAAALSAILLNKAGLSIPQLLLATAVMNAIVAIYIYTLVPEFLMRFLTWILINTLYRIRLQGLENIPDEGPALLVCNHVSFVDPLILGGSVRRPVRFVMYYKIYDIPGLNFIFRTAKAIPIAGAKEDPALLQRAFEEVDKELAEGNVVCIFPEGGITRDGEIAPFRPGVERILAARPVPVVPLALRGLWGSIFSRKDSWLNRARLPRRFRSRIELVAGPAVPPGEASAEVLEAKVRELRGEMA
ncbi:MAG: MFS transporter [Rudaea sp.]|uniref:MFS transporter n=1 Tax=unclassified Rudaea TaxID=2627037 RepID=UPI0010F8628C|nr:MULTISPECIES: MFS transporter [unclassified Rudaea]MBN8886060.1 MFS transporter [Rudaea sp.]MBR0345963.1 MFS transporter [Rudaea sp.]